MGSAGLHTSKEGLIIRDVKVKGSLSCSDHKKGGAQDPEWTKQGKKQNNNAGVQESRL